MRLFAADGETILSNIKLIDRGYEDIESQLNSVGAKNQQILNLSITIEGTI